jgi:predicted RNA-binding protein YlqC (UPF0109 family)
MLQAMSLKIHLYLRPLRGLDERIAGRKLLKEINKDGKINMAKETADQEFLEYLIKALVDHPDDVKIDRKVDEMGVLLSLKVNPEDMGQIIGKAGSTARSIRSLVRIVGLKNHARVNLKIEEPEGSTRGRARRAPAGEELEDLKL